jgi:uncharacterized coiled-coil protein SlyX
MGLDSEGIGILAVLIFVIVGEIYLFLNYDVFSDIRILGLFLVIIASVSISLAGEIHDKNVLWVILPAVAVFLSIFGIVYLIILKKDNRVRVAPLLETEIATSSATDRENPEEVARVLRQVAILEGNEENAAALRRAADGLQAGDISLEQSKAARDIAKENAGYPAAVAAERVRTRAIEKAEEPDLPPQIRRIREQGRKAVELTLKVQGQLREKVKSYNGKISPLRQELNRLNIKMIIPKPKSPFRSAFKGLKNWTGARESKESRIRALEQQISELEYKKRGFSDQLTMSQLGVDRYEEKLKGLEKAKDAKEISEFLSQLRVMNDNYNAVAHQGEGPMTESQINRLVNAIGGYEGDRGQGGGYE